MKVMMVKCPACGGQYDGEIVRGIMTCEYCGSRFALEEDELAALGLSDASAEDEGEEYETDFWDGVRAICGDFYDDVDDDSFYLTDKIIAGLGIDDDQEEIFLIHDDTIFKSGKNGFAITDNGFYYRGMGEPEGYVVYWKDFAECEKPVINGSDIVVNDVAIAYFTGNSAIRDRLLQTYRDLRKHARNYDWSEE